MKTLEEEVRDATDDQVNAARLRLKTKIHEIDNQLNKLTLATHLTAVQILATMAQHRQQILSQEAAELQRKDAIAQHEKQMRANAKAFEERAKLPFKYEGPLVGDKALTDKQIHEQRVDAVSNKTVPIPTVAQ